MTNNEGSGFWVRIWVRIWVRVRVGQERGAVFAGEEGFEKQGGGYLVDEVLAVKAIGSSLTFLATVVEKCVGLARGEAFIEQMVLEIGVRGEEFCGEGFCFYGLLAWGAIGMQGQADDEGGDLVAADEAAYGFEVGVELRSVEGEERLRGEAEAVGEGEADAAVADVEGHDATDGHEDSLGAA